jgi:sugar phosphate isomerase/epimerase
MPRPLLLHTASWADQPLEEVAARAAEFGYRGVELCCRGDHLEVQRALAEDDYANAKLELLRRFDLDVLAISAHEVTRAVCDPIDLRHRESLPEYVWGDGEPAGVQQRATEETIAIVRAAQTLGVGLVVGMTGSPIRQYLGEYPPVSMSLIQEGISRFVEQWTPILEACRDCGVRFALEVQPGQIAFDLYSTEMVLDTLGSMEEFGLTLSPMYLHWQGIDSVVFARRFAERLYHVHVNDAVISLDGRMGLLGSYLSSEDHRRGWQPRSPGRGGIDWESLIRGLNSIQYGGALSVDWCDPGMDRAFGAEEACRFVQRLDFEPGKRQDADGFR